jgi:hypothetical protein
MPILGTLDDLSLVDLVSVLTMRRATGRLAVDRSGERALLYFEDGRLVFVSSSSIGQRLGEVLIEQGKLTPETLQLALDWQQFISRDIPTLGALLLDQRLITKDDLRQALIEQAEQILFHILLWPNGRFEYRSGPIVSNSIPLPSLNVEKIILEAVRRADERDGQVAAAPSRPSNNATSDLNGLLVAT